MQTALKLFIDNVPTLVIEVALIEPILNMFCPTHVISMKTETVASIAAENEEKKSIRDALTRKLTVLNAGATTCQVYAARQSARKLTSTTVQMASIFIISSSRRAR